MNILANHPIHTFKGTATQTVESTKQENLSGTVSVTGQKALNLVDSDRSGVSPKSLKSTATPIDSSTQSSIKEPEQEAPEEKKTLLSSIQDSVKPHMTQRNAVRVGVVAVAAIAAFVAAYYFNSSSTSELDAAKPIMQQNCQPLIHAVAKIQAGSTDSQWSTYKTEVKDLNLNDLVEQCNGATAHYERVGDAKAILLQAEKALADKKATPTENGEAVDTSKEEGDVTSAKESLQAQINAMNALKIVNEEDSSEQ